MTDNKVVVTGTITEEEGQYITIETDDHVEIVGYVLNYPTLSRGAKVTAEGYLKRNHLDSNIFCIKKLTKIK